MSEEHKGKGHNSTEHQEDGTNKEGVKTTRSDLILFAILATIIIVVVGLVLLVKFYKPAPKDIDTILKENFDKDPTETNYVYNNYSFVKLDDGFWHTQGREVGASNVFDMMFNYGPKEVDNISITGSPYMDFLKEQKVYVTFDPLAPADEMPYMAVAASEVSLSLNKVFMKSVTAACTKNETDACATIPTVVCDGKTTAVFLNPSNTTSVVWNNKCVTISGSKKELVRAAERLLYKLYNIVE